MQEDKEMTYDAIDTVKACISLFDGMLSTITFRKEVMERSAMNGFTNATDAADYLVGKGVPFRDAHRIVGELVLFGLANDKALLDFSLDEYRAISPVFDEDIYEAISLKTCVEKRMTIGAPGPDAMSQLIKTYRAMLAD
jgi:argininosuccinate lyase